MKIKNKMANRIMSVLLSIALLMTCVPNTLLVASANSAATSTVTDPGTAHTWETMLGTSSDGNRYAGRVWVDKSVYKDGDVATLNTSGQTGSTFNVSLEDDEEFQVIFSALGSSMTTTTTSSSTGPMDVVLVLDTSTSMDDTTNGVTRLQRVIEAANELIDDLLTINNVRIAVVTYNADSETVIDLAQYTNGVNLKVNNYYNSGSDRGVVYAYDDNNTLLGKDSGYTMGTNLQAGIDRGFNILANAGNVEGRLPVAIVLTDGQANRAVRDNWYNISRGSTSSGSSGEGLVLSTMLNAAYNKTKIEAHYNAQATIYSVSVDLSANEEAHALMNPGSSTNGFNSSNSHSDIREAVTYFNQWSAGNNVTIGRGNSSWTFDHNYPTLDGTITRQAIIDNINYVKPENYYDVSSADLEIAFNQIYEELSSGVFNPISSSTTVDGATGVENTPLIYVDNIGQYMEIKEIQAVTLFGASYGVVRNADGTYTVQSATGTNPTTNEAYNTADHIKITVTEIDGTQKLQIEIAQEILPIILEQVTDKTVSGVNNATINELTYSPLRVYYTVGLDSDILLPNGEINVSKIASGYQYINNEAGEITFYSNAFGTMNNTDANGDGLADKDDAHVGFKPSTLNRYYYHQANHGIFTKITSKTDGSTVTIPENNTYGMVWDEDAYELTWMSYEEYLNTQDVDKVYTYVTYYRPTASTSDAANAAEKVTYLVYTDWGYLKESVAFYDATTNKYINYDSATNSYSLDDEGKVVDPTHIASYVASNPNADVYAVLGVGSLRTSRFHNMIATKAENATGTATNRYTPEYTHNTPSDTNNHYGNDVVVWLGNNGKLTRTIDTGIALTKVVTEAIGKADDTYALTVTVPSGVAATPVVKDVAGNVISATYENNVLTVNLKAGETVYITGIPAGTHCTIGEVIQDGSQYYIASKTDEVTVPYLADVIGANTQYINATVTNAPNKYGDLTIVKDVSYAGTLTSEMQNALAGKVFTFTVDVGVALEGKTFDTYNTAGMKNDTGVTVENGKFTVTLKDNESITIKDLPEGTTYTVTETNANGLILTNSVGESVENYVVSGTISAYDNDTAHFVNTYNAPTGSATIAISGTKTLNGTSYEAQTFNFAVQKWNGSAYETIATTNVENDKAIISAWQTGESTKTDGYSIGLNLSDLTLGTHYYRVVEVLPENLVAGMTYDASVGRFRVIVADSNMDGTAEIRVEEYNGSAWEAKSDSNGTYNIIKHFTNRYDVLAASVTIPVIKNLQNNTGVDISKDIFSFKLEQKADAEGNAMTEGTPVVLTANADVGGNAAFQITYLEKGTYYYYLTENIPDNNNKIAGMSYDGTTYLVTVNVNSVAEGSNELTATYNVTKVGSTDQVSSITFNNEYKLTPATWTPKGIKKLEGRSLDDGEFSFDLYQTTASFLTDGYNDNAETQNLPRLLETVQNSDSDDYNINFSEITYTQVGTYYYSVKEIKGDVAVAGVTYDTTHYHVTVTVGINDTNKTELAITNVSVNKIGTNSGAAGQIVFVNDYNATPVEYALSGTKTLNGRAMSAGEFTFELYEEGNSDAIQTATNKADGSFIFNAIQYTKPGEYKYTIKEVKGDETRGVTYNGAEYPMNVTITVENNVNTTDNTVYLSASADVSNANIKFENTYKAAPAKLTFDGEKALIGDTLVDNSFTFKLYETDHTFNIAGLTPVDTKTNVNGAFTFDTRTFDKTGTYFYAIVEDATDPINNIVYDSTQYNFRVQVSDIGDGQLRVVVLNLNTGSVTPQPVDEILNERVFFTNATFDEVTEKEVYLAGNTTTEIDGKKVNVGDILTYNITYTNYTGKDAVVDIMDTIPAHTSYVEGSATHNGTYAGTHLNWVLNVLKGESVTVSFKVKVDEAEAIMTNTAIIRDGINTYTTNEVINHTVEEIVEKDAFLSGDPTISIDGQKITVGDELLYTIRYSNITGNPVVVTIKDKIPAYTTYVEDSADNGGVYADGEITWNLNLDAWEDVTVSFKVTAVDEGTEIANEATVLDGNNTYTTNKVVIHTDEPGKSDPIPEPTPVPTPDPTPEPEDDGRVYKSFAFVKVWNDNNDKLGKRPDSITVELYQDGVYVTDVILSKENGWTDTAILMYANGDHVYEWTMKEKNVPAGYVATYKQSEGTVINTLKELSTVTNGPGTGDDSNLGFFLGAAAVSLIAIIGLVVLMKFRKKDDE